MSHVKLSDVENNNLIVSGFQMVINSNGPTLISY